jgi:hypothetical protein
LLVTPHVFSSRTLKIQNRYRFVNFKFECLLLGLVEEPATEVEHRLVAAGGLHSQQLEVLVEEVNVSDGKFNLFYSEITRQLDRILQPLRHCLREVLNKGSRLKSEVGALLVIRVIEFRNWSK